jgi:hypothetical protein
LTTQSKQPAMIVSFLMKRQVDVSVEDLLAQASLYR